MVIDCSSKLDLHFPPDLLPKKALDDGLSWLLNLLLSETDPRFCEDDNSYNALQYGIFAMRWTYVDFKDRFLPGHELVHWLVYWLSEACIILICCGIDVHTKDNRGISPLEQAWNDGSQDVILSSSWYAQRMLRSTPRKQSNVASTKAPSLRTNAEGGVRKRRRFTFDADDESSGLRSGSELSDRNLAPCSPHVFEHANCCESCPFEWPIAWRLWIHRECPRSCTDEILALYEMSLRETHLRDHLPELMSRKWGEQDKSWERIYEGLVEDYAALVEEHKIFVEEHRIDMMALKMLRKSQSLCQMMKSLWPYVIAFRFVRDCEDCNEEVDESEEELMDLE